jgi:glutamate-5-semialdehyde dehydrogenase
MNPNHYLRDLGETAKKASRAIASANTETKNTALVAMADELIKQKSAVLIANKKDVDNAKKNNLTDAFIDRLTLTELTVTNMAEGLIQISKLPDPVGEISVLTPQPFRH